jgi:2,3-bisphosphoglycerate-independent phosphoglycerate mutase
MYRGLAKLVGMEALAVGPAIEDSLATLKENWGRFDFFFVHYKYTDTAGEDGDFDRKVAKLEEVDAAINALVDLEPDVLMIAGDHSTPAKMASHSWHPLPVILHSAYCLVDTVKKFDEVACLGGALGRMPTADLMPLALANARRLNKFGA